MNEQPVNSPVQHPDPDTTYPRQGDRNTCYLKNVVKDPTIQIGDFSFYNAPDHPEDFEHTNVLYHYPINQDRLIVGKFCSIACGAKFIFNGANHTLHSFSTYPFPIFPGQWDPNFKADQAWDQKGDILIGNDVWIGFEAVILAGVTVGDGSIIGTRALVTHDVPPYSIVGGVPAKVIRRRFDDATVEKLMQIRWWDWPIEKIQQKLPAIRGMRFDELM
jgi:virginiamycin A acetyltransferase